MSARTRILVVEDDAAVAGFLIQALEMMGFHVTDAADADAALQALANQVPKVILTDCNFPGRSGKELIGEIVALHPHIPIVAMSADHSNGNGMLAAGASMFLEKPLDYESLRSAFAEHLASTH